MKSLVRTGAAALALSVAFFAPPGARAGDRSWWLDVEAGAEYDDNVAVDSSDANSGKGDVAATFELDAGYKLVNTDNSRVEIGYDFYQSLYQDVSAFDYQSHNPTFNAWTKFDGIKLGFNYSYLYSLLDNSFFLEEHVFAPSVSAYLSDNFYVTATYRYYMKDYDAADNARDAQTHQPGADIYYYFDKPNKGFVSVGGGYTNEDTEGLAFDYSGFVGRTSVQFPVALFDHKGRVKFSYTYQKRDYDNDESLLPVGDHKTRSDDRHTLRAYGDMNLTDSLEAVAEFRFINRNSNLLPADYNENIASLGLRYGF